MRKSMPRNIDPGTIQIGSGAESVAGGIDSSSLSLISSHISDPSGAHAASAISVDDHPSDIFSDNNVEDALDDLSALIPDELPKVGEWLPYTTLDGIIDWGALKNIECSVNNRTGGPTIPFDPADQVGYWYNPTEPLQNNEFTVVGRDPVDPIFNVDSGGYTGSAGRCRAGAYTRNAGGPNPITQSLRIMNYIAPPNYSIISGVVFPANKGVLALLNWPAQGDMAAFLAQGLTTRCIAALKLGNGLADGADGTTGGMFTIGTDGSGNYDPFDYPGAATGQYSLEELHTGLSDIDGAALPAPFNVPDTYAGQVRLGIDLNAGPLVAGGIPILGGSASAHGGGNNDNFFAYRLPYLIDYSSTGLRYTPDADKPRYFKKPAVSYLPATDLTQAGNYPNGTTNFWKYQVARFRHRFILDSTIVGAGSYKEDGNLIFVHFKTEAAFEALVRDGTAPSDSDLYSPNLVNWVNPEDPLNVVATVTAGAGISDCYHVIRSCIMEDNGTTAAVPTFTTTVTVGATTPTISGVYYFVTSQMSVTDLALSKLTGYQNSYYTSEGGLTGDAFIGNRNPFKIDLSGFSNDDASIVAPAALVDPSRIRKGHLEFTYTELDGGYTSANGPLGASTAELSFTNVDPESPITFLGDYVDPILTQSLSSLGCIQQPMNHESTHYKSVARITNVFAGVQTLTSSASIVNPTYGNIYSGPGVIELSLESNLKDYQERFLDEVYRVHSSFWIGGGPDTWVNTLLGPGLDTIGAINFPVQAGSNDGLFGANNFSNSSWMINSLCNTTLANAGVTNATELEVRGLPTWSIMTDVVQDARPSKGMLGYPKINYSVGYRPSFAIEGVVQPNYSTCTGLRKYIRCFDASCAGTSAMGDDFRTFIIKLHGYDFSQLFTTNPNHDYDVRFYVKVPGLTTWMDLMLEDGFGPSKQDRYMDGAGCRVVSEDMVTSSDPLTRLRYTQFRVNVGENMNPDNFPGARLFQDPVTLRYPVLFKVTMKDSATSKTWDLSGADPIAKIGLCGVEIVPE
jgi:hypothetical protein